MLIQKIGYSCCICVFLLFLLQSKLPWQNKTMPKDTKSGMVTVASAPFVVAPQKESKSFQPESNLPGLPFTQTELDMMTAVVMHEVGHCSTQSKQAVTHVILNRLKDGRFGSSITEILHTKDQFEAIENYYYEKVPVDEACRNAVMQAIYQPDTTNGALYYCNLKYIKDEKTLQWFHSMQLVLQLEGQNYYK